MSRPLRTLLAVLFTTSLALPALAQSENLGEVGDSFSPPAEHNIDFDTPLAIEGELVGPGGEFLEAFRAPDGQSLVPNRVSFVDLLIESADQI